MKTPNKLALFGLLVGICGLASAKADTIISAPISINAPISSLGSGKVGNTTYPDVMVYNKAYEWGIKSSDFTGVTDFSTIYSVSISVNATLYNNTVGTLFLSLLGSSPVNGLQTIGNPVNKENGKDYWATQSNRKTGSGKNISYASYTSLANLPYGTGNNKQDSGKLVSYTLSDSELGVLIADLGSHSNGGFNGFNIGFDPDCTYAISSLNLTYTTYTTYTASSLPPSNVPDTATTAGLLGVGFLGLVALRRKLAVN